MKSGTKLAVESSVTTGEIGGSGTVTFEPGSTLALNFTSASTPPVIAFSAASSLDLPGAGDEPLKVKIAAEDDLSFHSVDLPEKYQVTTNGKFSDGDVPDGKVVLDDASPFWVRGIGVEDGNLYVYTRAPGLSLSVR